MRGPVRTVALALLAVLWLGAMGLLAAYAEGFVPETLRQLLLVALVIGPALLFGEAILEFVFHVIAYGIGRALLPVISLGKLRAESLGDGLSFPWHGVARTRDGRLVLSADGTSVVGLVALAVGGAAIYLGYGIGLRRG